MLRRTHLAFGLALGSGSIWPTAASAQQFVLMDETFTFTKEQADHSEPSPSHVYVRESQLAPGRPRDFTQPVDYRHGTVHIRTEVIDKPAGGETTQWSICYIPYVGVGPGYGCTYSGTYATTGVYERDESMTEFWQNDAIDWTQGIREIHLVMKDADGANGHAHRRTDAEKFFPTRVRITLTQVARGSTAGAIAAPSASSAPPARAAQAEPPARAPAQAAPPAGCSYAASKQGATEAFLLGALVAAAALALRPGRRDGRSAKSHELGERTT
jgi:hypothetical protein